MSVTPLHGEGLSDGESDTCERQGAFGCVPWRGTALDIMLPLEKCGAVLTTSAQVRGQYFMWKVLLKTFALGKGGLVELSLGSVTIKNRLLNGAKPRCNIYLLIIVVGLN